MTRLQTQDGNAFATGEARFKSRPAHPLDHLTRVHVQVQVGEVYADAVVDSGGAYLVLDPVVAARVVLGPAIHDDRLVIRGFVITGTVHRIPVTIPADAGQPLTFEATAFVPELGDGEAWPLPSYLGWQGVPRPHPPGTGSAGRAGVLRRGGLIHRDVSGGDPRTILFTVDQGGIHVARPETEFTPTSQMPQRQVKPIPGAMDWLKEHWDEYAGQWVAIGPNGLVAAAPTYGELKVYLDASERVLIAQLV